MVFLTLFRSSWCCHANEATAFNKPIRYINALMSPKRAGDPSLLVGTMQQNNLHLSETFVKFHSVDFLGMQTFRLNSIEA